MSSLGILGQVRGRVTQTRRHLSAILRLKPYDTSTEEGRGQERLRRIGLSALTSMAAKLIATAASLISIPLTTGYLGSEQFGLWMTILSVTQLLSMADLGIGNGLVSLVAEAHGRDDRVVARQLVSNAFFLLFGMGALITASVLAFRSVIPWDRLIGLHSQEAGPATVLALCLFGLGLPLGLSQRALAAYQEGFTAGLIQIAGGLFSLGGVLIAVLTKAGIFGLVLAVSGAPLVVSFFSSAFILLRKMPWLLPRLADISRTTSKSLFRYSSVFLCLQIAIAIGFNSDSLVLAHIVGGSAVAEYAVTAKLFAIPQLLLSYVLMPLWPAYGEAIAKGDIAWVRKILRRSIVLSLTIMLAFAVVLALSGRWLLAVWTGGKISASPFLLGSFAVWSVVTALGGPLSMFLNGAKVVGPQIVIAITSAAGNIALSIMLARAIGVSGVVLGSVTSQVFLVFVPYAFLFPRLLRGIERRERVSP